MVFQDNNFSKDLNIAVREMKSSKPEFIDEKIVNWTNEIEKK